MIRTYMQVAVMFANTSKKRARTNTTCTGFTELQSLVMISIINSPTNQPVSLCAIVTVKSKLSSSRHSLRNGLVPLHHSSTTHQPLASFILRFSAKRQESPNSGTAFCLYRRRVDDHYQRVAFTYIFDVIFTDQRRSASRLFAEYL